MTDALVSCVVPVFNGDRFLRETLEHILGQSHRDLEVVVVDDGSTDESAAVAASFHERVRCVTQSNRGETAARNAGLQVCRGQFIAFCDADDLWHPDKLERQIAAFQGDPRLDVCFTRYRNFEHLEDASGGTRRRVEPQPASGYLPSTLVARRTAFERFGAFPGEDSRHPTTVIWVLRARVSGARVEILPDVLMSRRLHAHNLSYSKQGLDHFLPILKTWLDYNRTRPPGAEMGHAS